MFKEIISLEQIAQIAFCLLSKNNLNKLSNEYNLRKFGMNKKVELVLQTGYQPKGMVLSAKIGNGQTFLYVLCCHLAFKKD